MTMQSDLAPQPVTPPQAAARCPHLIFHNVLGAERVAALLDYVAERQADFRASPVRNRKSGERFVDTKYRVCVSTRELGGYEAPMQAFAEAVTPQALAAFNLVEPQVELQEFTMMSYGDGGYFRRHIDTDERVNRVRLLSFVYYFATTPRRFEGGQLRLHGFPIIFPGKAPGPAPTVDVQPDTNSLVVFPSWLHHEVLPVRVASGAWMDSRFTIGCWLHRKLPAEAVVR